MIWAVPKIRGTFFGGPYNEDYSIFGSILGSLILGNYHIRFGEGRPGSAEKTFDCGLGYRFFVLGFGLQLARKRCSNIATLYMDQQKQHRVGNFGEIMAMRQG